MPNNRRAHRTSKKSKPTSIVARRVKTQEEPANEIPTPDFLAQVLRSSGLEGVLEDYDACAALRTYLKQANETIWTALAEYVGRARPQVAEPRERYMKVSEVARAVGLSTKTLYRWEASGRFPPIKRQRRLNHRLYTKADVEAIERFKERGLGGEPPVR